MNPLEQGMADLDAAAEFLEAMTGVEIPEPGAEWVENKAFDLAVGGAVGASYRTADRKRDRQRMVPIHAVISALAALEDATVRAAVRGPLRSALYQVSGPVRMAKRALDFMELLIDTEWRKLIDEGKKAVALWNSLKGSVDQKIAQFAGPFASEAQALAKRATDTVEDPAKITAAVFLVFAGAVTALALKKQVKTIMDARQEAVGKVKLAAWAQRRVRRVWSKKRTRN